MSAASPETGGRLAGKTGVATAHLAHSELDRLRLGSADLRLVPTDLLLTSACSRRPKREPASSQGLSLADKQMQQRQQPRQPGDLKAAG